MGLSSPTVYDPQNKLNSIESSLAQLTPVGTTVFQGVQATDADSGVNGLVEYMVVAGDPAGVAAANQAQPRLHVADGYGFFSINLPHQGQVTVNRSLDYERTQRYLVTIVATVSYCALEYPTTPRTFSKKNYIYMYFSLFL